MSDVFKREEPGYYGAFSRRAIGPSLSGADPVGGDSGGAARRTGGVLRRALGEQHKHDCDL
ncbi:hypothetical protein SAMN05444169_1400 [Bradyrhizobium erythrophlei]|uniref:Uncharacterized protein n=1 Tax=Bradyrhizobium erythrophlei TaxID=1437360 RepID=A0A1M5I9G6_9BRAD|nr:hypothetical protein SAMN05444169_1400 [Bradyrhizobium erythrophlei]